MRVLENWGCFINLAQISNFHFYMGIAAYCGTNQGNLRKSLPMSTILAKKLPTREIWGKNYQFIIRAIWAKSLPMSAIWAKRLPIRAIWARKKNNNDMSQTPRAYRNKTQYRKS